MPIDITKKYKTRSGLDVLIYAIHKEGMFPVHGAIAIGVDWVSESWTNKGTYLASSLASSRPCDEDLVEVKNV